MGVGVGAGVSVGVRNGVFVVVRVRLSSVLRCV